MDAETTDAVKMGTGAAGKTPYTTADRIIDIMFWASLVLILAIYFRQFTLPIHLLPFFDQPISAWDPKSFSYPAAHVGAAGIMTSIWFISRKRHSMPRWLIGGAMIIGFAVPTYYVFQNAFNMQFRGSYGTGPDIVLGLIVIVQAFVLSWIYWGPVFPVLGLIFIAYVFFAGSLPGPLRGPDLDTQQILTRMVHKSFVDVVILAAQFLWMLIFWGLLMSGVGGGISLLEISRRLSRGIAGGPAMGSLVSSAITGSFVGGGASNVAITGPVTIPAMKRAGYSAEEAGSIEAMASNASAITPPILGTVAFIMADLLGVSYVDIIIMSLIPCMLWFVAVGTWIVSHAQANKHRIRPITMAAGERPVTPSLFIRSLTIIMVPVSVIVILVVQGYTLKTGAVLAFLITVILALLLRVETRLKAWTDGMRDAAFYASSLTVILIIVAIISDALVFTGLGGRLGDIIETLSRGNLLVAAFIMIFIGIILGGPLPAIPIYFIMIVTFAPVLQRMGVQPEVTHYVSFYMGNLGSITLPVAASCLVAAAVAQTKYWPTAVKTAKVAWPLMVYPVLFVLSPELLLFPDDDSQFVQWAVVVSAFIVMIGVQAATGGWLIRRLHILQRLALWGNFLVLCFALMPQRESLWLLGSAIVVVVAVALSTLVFSQREAMPAVAASKEEARTGSGGG